MNDWAFSLYHSLPSSSFCIPSPCVVDCALADLFDRKVAGENRALHLVHLQVSGRKWGKAITSRLTGIIQTNLPVARSLASFSTRNLCCANAKLTLIDRRLGASHPLLTLAGVPPWVHLIRRSNVNYRSPFDWRISPVIAIKCVTFEDIFFPPALIWWLWGRAKCHGIVGKSHSKYIGDSVVSTWNPI